MIAKQRYDVAQIVALAHQVETFARIPKKLPDLTALLEKIRPRPKGPRIDQSDAVAAYLNRLAARSTREAEAKARAQKKARPKPRTRSPTQSKT
jgi:hypothetical protein